MAKSLLKISTVFLCGLLIYNSLGHWVVVSVMRMDLRQQMWSQLSTIPENKLTSFTFNKNEASSRLIIVNKHEIRVDGKLFDVVRKTENGNQIDYVCINDKQEESLLLKAKRINSQSQQMPVRNFARIIAEKIINTAEKTDKSDSFPVYALIPYKNIPEVFYQGPGIQRFLPPPKS